MVDLAAPPCRRGRRAASSASAGTRRCSATIAIRSTPVAPSTPRAGCAPATKASSACTAAGPSSSSPGGSRSSSSATATSTARSPSSESSSPALPELAGRLVVLGFPTRARRGGRGISGGRRARRRAPAASGPGAGDDAHPRATQGSPARLRGRPAHPHRQDPAPEDGALVRPMVRSPGCDGHHCPG